MEIFCAISVSLILMNCGKAQPAPWICNFQADECNISQSSTDDTFWSVQAYANGDQYYRPAINQVGDTYYPSGTFATCILPPASYPSSKRGVLSFRFLSYTTNPSRQHRYLTVTTCEGGNPVLKLGNFGEYWYFREIEFTCGSNPVKISFTAVRGSSRTNIGVDNINVTEILTATTEAVASAASQVTRGQTLTPSISPSLTSSSVSTYIDSTTRHDMSTGSKPQNTGTGNARSNHVVLPAVSSILIVLFICLIVTSYVCWRKRLRHGTSQGIAAFGDAGESPGIRDNPTFESSNVHDLRMSDDPDCQGENDPYMALTTPHDGRTFQVYQTLRDVNAQGDGYEVPVNGANGQTGPEYGKTLHKLQVHPETDYEITHEYQDLTNSVVGRNNSHNESPVCGLQVQPETEYEAIHEYEDPGMIGKNIPHYESHISVLHEMSKTNF